jgi:hypothetical protein
LDETIAGLDRELQGQPNWAPFAYGNIFDRAKAAALPLDCAPAALDALGPPIESFLFGDNHSRTVECERAKGRLVRLRNFLANDPSSVQPQSKRANKPRIRRANRAKPCPACVSINSRIYSSSRNNPKCYALCNDCGHSWPRPNLNYVGRSAT